MTSAMKDVPIVLPESSAEDMEMFQMKVTLFPKAMTDVTAFPE